MADTDNWFERLPGNYYKGKAQAQDRQKRNGEGRRRRYSDEYDDRPRYDDYEGRDDRRRDSHRSRNSPDEDKRRYSTQDRPRRDYDDDDRYGYEDQRRDNRPESRLLDDDEALIRQANPLTQAAAGGFAAGVAVGHAEGDAPRAGQATYSGYVPYSNIYGNNGKQSFSPPPSTSIGSPQPHSMNQVSPPRRGPPEDYDTYPRERSYRGYDGPPDRYNDDYPDERQSRSRPPRSRSHDSYNSGRDNRGDRRQDRGKSSSQLRDTLKDTLDKSQRGLGYSAVGAIAGGLVGSGVGRGRTPAAIGAVLGGLGANMFEARERFVNSTQRAKTTAKKRKDTARNTGYSQNDDMSARREQRQKDKRGGRNGDWKD